MSDLSRILEEGSKYMDECSRDYDARAKVFRYEERPFWHSYPTMTTSVNGESRTWRMLLVHKGDGSGYWLQFSPTKQRANQDDEDS